MTIGKRLRISYTLLVVIPFTLLMFVSYFMSLEYKMKFNNLRLSVQTPEFNKELYKTMGLNPDSLLEEDKLNTLLNLTLNKDDITVFVLIEKEFFIAAGVNKNNPPKDYDDQDYVNYWLFNLSDGRDAEIYFLSKSIKIERVPFTFFFPIIIFYITLISLLSFTTSRTITKPLKKLKEAAINIKNEEYDMDLTYKQNDEIKNVFIAFEDMRLRLKHNVEKQLRYEKNRKELITNISHDLRTPITAIKGYIEGILDGVANTPEKLQKYHHTILKKINILDRLIENLFLSSKLDLKTIPFHFQTLDLNLFITDIIEELKYENKNLVIDYTSNKESLKISGDPIQLQRVINNIIGNSIKYCNKDICHINISLIDECGYGTILIEDNGIGIPQQSINKIFNRFYRSDPARCSKIEGSGLGLAISKQIILEHSGNISAINNIDKDGITVTFKLPIIKEV